MSQFASNSMVYQRCHSHFAKNVTLFCVTKSSISKLYVVTSCNKCDILSQFLYILSNRTFQNVTTFVRSKSLSSQLSHFCHNLCHIKVSFVTTYVTFKSILSKLTSIFSIFCHNVCHI